MRYRTKGEYDNGAPFVGTRYGQPYYFASERTFKGSRMTDVVLGKRASKSTHVSTSHSLMVRELSKLNYKTRSEYIRTILEEADKQDAADYKKYQRYVAWANAHDIEPVPRIRRRDRILQSLSRFTYPRLPDHYCDHLTWDERESIVNDTKLDHGWTYSYGLTGPNMLQLSNNSITPGMYYSSLRDYEYSQKGWMSYPMSNVDWTRIQLTSTETKELLRSVQPTDDLLSAGINIWTILLELKDSINIVSSGVRALRALARSGNVSDTYLWYNWGAAPLIGDLNNLYNIFLKFEKSVDAWNKAATRGTFRVRTKAYIKNDYFSYSNENVMGTVNISLVGENKAICKLVYRPIKLDTFTYYRALFSRLGITNILSGVWEGIPFSWLVDYFVNVGEVLESFEPPVYLPFRGEVAIVSQKMSYRGTMTGKPSGNAPGSPSFSCTVNRYLRVPTSGPALDIVLDLSRLPKRKLELQTLSAKQAMNLVAFATTSSRK